MVWLIPVALPLLLSSSAPAAVDPGVRQQLARANVPFVPNAGQWDRQAAFAAQTFAGTLFVTTEGKLVYSLPGKPVVDTTATGNQADQASPGPYPRHSHDHQHSTERTPGWVLTETFVGADRQPVSAIPSGYRPAAAQVSYFFGNDAAGHQRGLDTFERIDFGNAFPGINVQLRATGTNVEKIFTVAPRHDPGQIRLQIGGATRLELGTQGELIVHTGNGPVTYTAPIAFQEDGQGQRQPVAVQYVLDARTNQYGFVLAAYDSTRPLVIDPLLQSTYLGGTSAELAFALVIHPLSGEVYVAGQTSSTTTFPGVSGGAQGSYGGGGVDAYVSRFSADLTTLIQSSYLGAAGNDQAGAMAIHPLSGEIYVAGLTNSLASTFPGVSGGAQGSYGGGSNDAFVSRFSADLTTLIRSTYLGAAGSDFVSALAIHPLSGDIYVAGLTDATTTTFPGASGGAQGSSGGGSDAFVSRFSADLATLIRSSYLGAAGAEQAQALAIHPISGEVYVAGVTNSTTTTFPGVTGGAQGSSGGGNDAFVSRFSADLTTLIRSSYLGAAGNDQATALTIHPVSGEVYMAGLTSSLTTTFPGVSGGAQATYGGGIFDAFVSRFSADLTALTQSSYVGAAGNDQAKAIAIHPVSGEVYVAGSTDSPTTTFPGVGGGAQGTSGGGNDAFVARFSLDLLAADVYPDPFSFTTQTGVAMNVIRTSLPVQIAGIGAPATVAVGGPLGSSFCISSGNNCSCDATPGAAFTATPAPIADSQFLCARHVSAPILDAFRETVVVVGGRAAKFLTFTGTLSGTCLLDVDGNGTKDALTDGLIILRALFGLTGTAVTNGAIGGGATRTTWAQLQQFLNGNCGTAFAP